MVDAGQGGAAPGAEALAPQLEARIRALEADRVGADFDAASWWWMILLGVALPLALLILLWRLPA